MHLLPSSGAPLNKKKEEVDGLYTVCSTEAALQIRRGKEDNLGIIFHKAPLKRMLQHIIRTVLPRRVY